MRRQTFHTAPAEVVKDIGAWRYRGELETTGLKKGKIYCGFRKRKNSESPFHSGGTECISYLLLCDKLPQNSVVKNKNLYFAQKCAIWIGFSREGLFFLLLLSAGRAQLEARVIIFKMAHSHGWQVGAGSLLRAHLDSEPWFLSPLAFPWTAWASLQYGGWIK